MILLKGLKSKQATQLVRANQQVHYKMYKAGIHWVTAGLSTIGGLFGLGMVAPAVAAKAATQAGVAQQVTDDAVTATSLASQRNLESTSLTGSTADQQSTATASVATATTTTSAESVTVTEQESASGKPTPTPTGSTTPVTSVTSPTTATTATSTKPTPADTPSGSTTAVADGATPATVAGSTLTSTGSEAPSQPHQVVTPTTAAPATHQPVLQPDVWDLKLPTAMLSSWLPGFLNTANKTPNQVGADDATKDLGDVLGGAYDNTFHMVTNAVNNTTNQMVNVITGGLLASKTPEPKIIRNIQKVSTIYQSYRDGKLVDNSQATPLWHDDNYNSLKLTGEDLAAYNQGYTHYLFNFAKGLSQWIDSIQDKATNPTTANQLIDDVTYNPNSMTGVTSSGQLGVAVIWATGENHGYAKDVLGYQSDGNVAASKIAQAVETVTDYVKIIAPNIIDGIAHQAMTDIRSLGGAINGDDYAPQTLSQAIQLNQNIATMVGNMGLTGLVSTSLFEDIYQGIRANAVTALENNWTIGENDALRQMLAEGDSTGAQNDNDPLYANFVKDKDAQTAGNITNNLFNTAGTLSTMSQQAGFTWAYKVLGQVINIANTDALGGTGKPDLAAIVTQLQASGTISATEANQILQGTQASHTITSGGRTTTYTRNSVGVQRVINEVYLAEYNAATAAVQDLTTNQTAPEQWVSQQQQNLTYQSPITKQWMPGMTTTLGVYEQLWGTMWSFAPGYLGMAAADHTVHQQQGPVSVPSQPWEVGSSITHAWADMLMFSGVMLTSTNIPQVQQALLDLGQRLAGQAYQQELVLANQAFNDGMALAHQQDAQSLDGSLPPVTQAGAYHGHDASNDGTGQVFLPQQSTVLDEWRGVVSAPAPGQIFQDGYQSQLETVTIYTKATGTSLFGPRFSNTAMSKLNNTKVNVLKGHADRLTRPSTDAKWRLVSTQVAPATVTFEYAPVPQEMAVSSANLQAVEGTYDGQPASQHLAGAQLQLQWADQSTKTITLQSDWVTVDQDQARVGDYQYQLSAKGIQVLLQQLQQGLPKTAAAPTLAQLTTAKGTVTLKPSATLVPHLTTHAVQVVAGQTVQPADMVTGVTDALGNPQDPALVTGSVDQVSQLAPGTHQVELTFTDPTSGETAHQSATVTVISQEASTSIANVVASTASASLATNLSVFDSQSVQLAHQSEQSLSGWASEMAADSASRFQDQSVSAALQSMVDANNQTFTVASASNAQADDQSLSALGSALSSASTSTSISTARSLADASVQQAVQSADQVFNQASASNVQVDDQSLSALGSTLTSIANSLVDASVQQAVQSADQIFNLASTSNEQADDQSLSALGSALSSASTSTSISTAMSLADASVQQAVQSADQVFNVASTSNEQADNQSLSALGSALNSASTSTSISIAMSLADASVQQAVQSADQIFNLASTSNEQADDQSLSALGSALSSASTSTSISTAMSLADASVQKAVQSANQIFNIASTSNAQADDQSLSALGSALSSASTSTSISTAMSLADASVPQAVQSADQVFNVASTSNEQADNQSLSALGSALNSASISTSISTAMSLTDASVQQAVQSADQIFNLASTSNERADDQSLSALGSALTSASTSTSISTAMSLADASVQQAVQSANQIFNLASTSNEQADDQSLSALGSALTSASTSTSISTAMSLADASVQRAVQSANQIFNIASASNEQATDQSLSALGSALSSASTSTSILIAMSLADASVQQAVQSADQVFNLASTSNEQADDQSLSALGTELAWASASTSIQQAVTSANQAYTVASLSNAQQADRSLMHLRDDLTSVSEFNSTLDAFTSASLKLRQQDDQSLAQWGQVLASDSLVASQELSASASVVASQSQSTADLFTSEASVSLLDQVTPTPTQPGAPLPPAGVSTPTGTGTGTPSQPQVTPPTGQLPSYPHVSPTTPADPDISQPSVPQVTTPTRPEPGTSFAPTTPDWASSVEPAPTQPTVTPAQSYPVSRPILTATATDLIDPGNLQLTGRTGSHQQHRPRPFQRFSVYPVRKIGLYRTPTFSAQQRLAWYHQYTDAAQAQFMVIGMFLSKHGRLRYKVRDINHGSKTYGLVGYITARWDFVRPTYYLHQVHTKVKVLVINPEGINGYRRPDLTGKRQHYAKGQWLTVYRLVHHHLTTRFQLSNGQYVTANRELVKLGRHAHHRLWSLGLPKTQRFAHWSYTVPNLSTLIGRLKP
ncbi:DUF5776 domain-containing protein [Levilactobacillus namurensis]|uniref:DUF5776 domain-containing protein n=1 Tax=Levilactobacillus namurensis TaxID=380393 RepID=A0AAW8W446_9LACO|nr:DUF5776 domain-containing protein [Levilactobacillus namurensis]MDT7013508.1 DUF5776 domain-containing protein [Levilactobacillus namurensis]